MTSNKTAPDQPFMQDGEHPGRRCALVAAGGRVNGPIRASVAVIVTSVIALVMIAGCGTSSRSIRRTPPPHLPHVPMEGVWHKVESGDSLWCLADQYDVPLQDLAELNNLANPDMIMLDSELFIPGVTTRITNCSQRLANNGSASSSPASSTGNSTAKPPSSKVSLKQQMPKLEKGRFQWPVNGGVLTSQFGARWGKHHDGIDIGAPSGHSIFAADSGVVIYSDNGLAGYGNLILIKHDERFVSVYAHNKKNLVKEGNKVRKGQVIAHVGSTGHSTGPHLHFEIRDGGKPRNPLFFVDQVH